MDENVNEYRKLIWLSERRCTPHCKMRYDCGSVNQYVSGEIPCPAYYDKNIIEKKLFKNELNNKMTVILKSSFEKKPE